VGRLEDLKIDIELIWPEIKMWLWEAPSGPHRLWRRITRESYVNLGYSLYSRSGLSIGPGPDVQMILEPMHPGIGEDPTLVEPSRASALIGALLPGRPIDQRYAATIPADDPLGQLSQADFFKDIFGNMYGGEVGDLTAIVFNTGMFVVKIRSVYRSLAGLPSFELVDVLLPLYATLCAMAEGHYHPLRGHDVERPRRYKWQFEVEERIAGRTAGLDDPEAREAVGFPGRIPTAIAPIRRPPPEPRAGYGPENVGGVWYQGLYYSCRNTRPEAVVKEVLANLLGFWGFEADPVVMAEVMEHLRSLRNAQPVRIPR
jgi:hypothetical protein